MLFRSIQIADRNALLHWTLLRVLGRPINRRNIIHEVRVCMRSSEIGPLVHWDMDPRVPSLWVILHGSSVSELRTRVGISIRTAGIRVPGWGIIKGGTKILRGEIRWLDLRSRL